jgi:hypothetical protein
MGYKMIAQALLVLLIGIYFIRTTWFLFSGVFSPLTPVAAIVLTICLFAFHKLPAATGAWFYAVIAMCVIGAIANGLLLFSASPTYSNPTNHAFSMISMVSFILLGGTLLWSVFGSSSAA